MSHSSSYQPRYTITPEILNRVAAISEAVGRLTVTTSAPQVTPQVTPQVGELLAAIQGEMSREALQSVFGLLDAVLCEALAPLEALTP